MRQFETAKEFIDVLNKIDNDYDAIVNELEMLDGETQDLLHEMEFASLNAREGFKLYKKMQDVRQRRRALKRRQEVLAPIKKFLETGTGKAAKNDISVMVANMRRISESHVTAKYKPRVRNDLTIAKKEDVLDAASN